MDNPAKADPVQTELALISAAHTAARSDNDGVVDNQLSAAAQFDRPQAPGVLLARRAVTLCGWLQNDNDFGRAMKVARRALVRLATLQEDNDTDRAERLYWEALLVGRVSDNKKRAMELLEKAKILAPEDDRVLDLELEFAGSIAAFGR